jgi:hypothetical protein
MDEDLKKKKVIVNMVYISTGFGARFVQSFGRSIDFYKR